MGLENPLLEAACRSLRIAALSATLAAAGCIVSPLDDITPSTPSQASDAGRMDAGNDAAAEKDAGQSPVDAGNPDAAGPEDASSEQEPKPDTAGRGGTGGRGGAGAGSQSTAGAAGAATMTPAMTDKATEEATRLYFDRIVQRTGVRCDCYPDAPNQSACNWYAPRKPHVDCMVHAHQEIGASTIDPLHCAADVELEWRQCYEAATCVNDSISVCNQTNLAERVACDLQSNAFVDRCIGVYNGITAADGFMQRASEFVQHICRCNPDGTIDPTTTCADTWHADTSPMTLDCVANTVYGLEARSLDQESSPAIGLLQCVSAALGNYAQCMNELAVSCDLAAQEQCSNALTTLLTDECGAQGIGIFTCISPT